jgi:hypothetical protein
MRTGPGWPGWRRLGRAHAVVYIINDGCRELPRWISGLIFECALRRPIEQRQQLDVALFAGDGKNLPDG